MDYVLGKDCKVYYGAADTVLASLTEATQVKKASLTGETGTADVSTRGSGGWKATAATLRDMSAEIEMVYKPGDAAYETLRDAWLANTNVALALLTGDKNTAGSEGPRGNFAITNMSRSEELEEGVMITFTAKLNEFAEWVDVAGSGS